MMYAAVSRCMVGQAGGLWVKRPHNHPIRRIADDGGSLIDAKRAAMSPSLELALLCLDQRILILGRGNPTSNLLHK
jgi:hypothetical protein